MKWIFWLLLGLAVVAGLVATLEIFDGLSLGGVGTATGGCSVSGWMPEELLRRVHASRLLHDCRVTAPFLGLSPYAWTALATLLALAAYALGVLSKRAWQLYVAASTFGVLGCLVGAAALFGYLGLGIGLEFEGDPTAIAPVLGQAVQSFLLVAGVELVLCVTLLFMPHRLSRSW